MPDPSQITTPLAVIGDGPGGYAAAFHAAALGLKATLISPEPEPGGVCLHRGCIPSKALLHVARLLDDARHAETFGVTFGEPKIDLDRLRAFKADVVTRLATGVAELCRRRKVDRIHARATFADSSTLTLNLSGEASASEPRAVRFEHAILATGSSPARPATLDIDDPRIMDSSTALELPDVPGTLLVIGGGYIGLELGCVYAALGSRVTVVEMTGGLLPGVDRDLVRPLKARLTDRFEAIHTGTEVRRLEPRSDGILAQLHGDGAPTEARFDRVLVAVGRRPNSRDLGLENTHVRLDDHGFVEVDDQQRTADPRILAVGDVAGEPMLAHKATRQAKVAVEVLVGQPARFDNVAIPAVVFTDPELAWCGLTETQAKAEGRKIKAIRYPWAASGRAMTLGRTEGQTKLIIDPETERVLGVGIVGPGAGELIAEGVLAVESGTLARDLAKAIHPHPTLSETMAEAADAFYGHATHLYRPKRR